MTSKSTNSPNEILAPISLGELIDKITILEIKKIHMTGIKKTHVNKELELLRNTLQEKNLEVDMDLVDDLKETNNCIWKIEDQIRVKEKKHQFDKEFIELARAVYKNNDRRASLKKEINQKYNSSLIEEKSYSDY